MGFFDRIGMRDRPVLTEHVVHVQLTQLGETKLKNLEPVGRKFDVVAAIKKLSPCSAKEIAEEIRWPENKVRFMLAELLREGWIEKVG